VANDGILSFYLANAPKIACIYLSVWAVRYKAGIDRPLDGRAKTVRWSVTAAGFIVVRMASSPYVRLIGFTVGMVLLCWPNVAYHLTKKIVSWPTTQGFVESASPVESGWRIGYSFQVGKNRFGGTTIIHDGEDSAGYREGQPVTVRYNPGGPDDSKLVCDKVLCKQHKVEN